MLLFQKFILLLIIFIGTYILFRLLDKRLKLLHEMDRLRQKEGMTLMTSLFSSPEKELASLSRDTTNISKIQSVNSTITNMPLCQYCIKAAYNCAFTGAFMNPDMIKYVLSRGCRFLDFEVYIIDDVPYVSYSTDTNNTLLEAENHILLDNALTVAVSNGFAPPTPNKADPLFIHLRIKSTDKNAFALVAKSVDYALSGILYPKPISPSTLLSDVMGQVVLIVDKTINPGWKTFDHCQYVPAATVAPITTPFQTTPAFTGPPSIQDRVSSVVSQFKTVTPAPSQPIPTTPSIDMLIKKMRDELGAADLTGVSTGPTGPTVTTGPTATPGSTMPQVNQDLIKAAETSLKNATNPLAKDQAAKSLGNWMNQMRPTPPATVTVTSKAIKTNPFTHKLEPFVNMDINGQKCYSLAQYVNMESGSEYLYIYSYSGIAVQPAAVPRIRDDNMTTDLNSMMIVVPDINATVNSTKTVFQNYIRQYGSQIVPYMFYHSDSALSSSTPLNDYEKFFNDNQAGIVPVAMAIRS